MCRCVIAEGVSDIKYPDYPGGIVVYTPKDLYQLLGVQMEVTKDDWDSCFCGLDPEPALIAAGWTVEHCPDMDDWLVTPNQEGTKDK